MVSRTVQIDGLLDMVSKLSREKAAALDQLLVFQREHPEFADDPVLQEIHFNLL